MSGTYKALAITTQGVGKGLAFSTGSRVLAITTQGAGVRSLLFSVGSRDGGLIGSRDSGRIGPYDIRSLDIRSNKGNAHETVEDCGFMAEETWRGSPGGLSRGSKHIKQIFRMTYDMHNLEEITRTKFKSNTRPPDKACSRK